MSYIDGFVVPVPESNLKSYRAMAQKAGKIWREHGALHYVEAIGDDLDVQFGVSFKKVIKPKPGETILFSFIIFKSRADRDKVNARVMKDPRMNKLIESGADMPFDVKRMCYGGFKSLIDM